MSGRSVCHCLKIASTFSLADRRAVAPAQAEALIAKRLSDGNFFNDPRVSVLEKEFSSQGISILGEVQKPGVYQMHGPRRLYDALSTAGGTTPRAGNTVSLLPRSDSQKAEVVTLSYDGKSSSQSNIYVYPGDTITSESLVLSKRDTSRPDRGVVKFRTTGHNQRGEKVLEYERPVLIRKRNPG